MKEVRICVGSSCHLKGAHKVVRIFKDMVQEYNLEKDIELKASFCLGQCTNGVVISIDDQHVTGVTPENAAEIFYNFFVAGDNYEAAQSS